MTLIVNWHEWNEITLATELSVFYFYQITGQSYRIKGKLLYDEEGDVGKC